MKTLERLLGVLDRQRAWLPLLLRLAVGATFIFHGYGKISHYESSVEGMGKMNMPLGTILVPTVPVVEFVGGICVVLGVATRFWAFAQSWVMVFAICFVHWKNGFSNSNKGWEWQALILAACLVLVLGGPGILSIDHALRSRLQTPEK